jgi:protein TonB
MFESSLIESTTQKVKTQTKWYFLGTMIAYFLIVSSAIIAGIMLVDNPLKEQILGATLVAPPPPPPPPPPAAAPAPVIPKNVLVVSKAFVAPTKVLKELPKADMPVVQVESSAGVGVIGGVPGGVPGGVMGGVVGGVIGGVPAAAPPPKEEPKEEAKVLRRVSGGVLQGNAIRRVQPTYPPIARSARVAGTVEVEVVIDEDGNVLSASVISGHPLLRQAAVEAAQQWKFRPTLLSGQPIKVTGVLIFNFRL